MRHAAVASAIAAIFGVIAAPALSQQIAVPDDIQQRLPRELQASVEVCWAGRMVPDRMQTLAAARGYAPMSRDEMLAVAPEAAQGANLAGWSDGEGEDEVRLITYETAIGGFAHVICAISAVNPTPEETFAIMYEVFEAPRREDWRDGKRYFSWYWVQEGRYVMADYIVDEDGSAAIMKVKAQAVQ